MPRVLTEVRCECGAAWRARSATRRFVESVCSRQGSRVVFVHCNVDLLDMKTSQSMMGFSSSPGAQAVFKKKVSRGLSRRQVPSGSTELASDRFRSLLLLLPDRFCRPDRVWRDRIWCRTDRIWPRPNFGPTEFGPLDLPSANCGTLKRMFVSVFSRQSFFLFVFVFFFFLSALVRVCSSSASLFILYLFSYFSRQYHVFFFVTRVLLCCCFFFFLHAQCLFCLPVDRVAWTAALHLLYE